MIAFVGLGPAGSGSRLLPARALDLLSRATLVIAEPAVASELEALAPNATMVEQAIAGGAEALAAAERHRGDAEALVVRVVAGDVAQRAGDEIRAASELVSRAAIEIVPTIGLESAIAAYVGIVFSPNVRMVTAAEVMTLLPEAPLTRVQDLGTARQRVTETLARDFYALSSSLAGSGSSAPPPQNVHFIAGAHPDPSLRWFDRRPLFGKRILVTRAREQAGELVKLLEERGAEALVAPSIAIHPPPDVEPLRQGLRDLSDGKYTWVAFTSANAVRRVAEAIAHEGKDARIFASAKIAAIGPGTARALTAMGITADLVAKEFIGESLAAAIVEQTGSSKLANPASKLASPASIEAAAPASKLANPPPLRVLLPRALVARDAAPEMLRAHDFEVDVVAAYETRAPSPSNRESLLRELESLDAVTFTSSSTVTNLVELLVGGAAENEANARKRDSAAARLRDLAVASIGPITTATCETHGIHVDATATTFTLVGLVEALERHFKSIARR